MSCDSDYEQFNSDDVLNILVSDTLNDGVVASRNRTTYSLSFDIFHNWGEKYYTFIVTKADGYCIGDKDPFPFYYDDDNMPHIVTDYTQYEICGGNAVFEFYDSGLRSFVPCYYDEVNGIGYYDQLKVGDKIAIWASKDKYTNEDLYLHAYDENYYNKLALSFECCYITTLKKSTIINYGMYDASWGG